VLTEFREKSVLVESRLWAIDLLTCTGQAVDLASSGGATILKGMLLRDVPLMVRIERD
jgi:hypothetical protein